ncbi:MAG TPA: shikimate kinase [Candidatus Acidoferrum sp.]|nr:shikimate kinase [Candidatus Acidoferrum sp.]
MSAEATAFGAVTIVNAIATGRGAAFGIDLWTKARVKLTDDGAIETRILNDETESTLFAETCVRAVFDRFGTSKLGAKVETNSNVPVARGLKSSSVAGNAIVLATLAALQKRLKSTEILNLVVDASLQAKVSVTGAFDDAAASLYGNVVVTDNMARKVLRTFTVEDTNVLLLVPQGKSYTADADLGRIKTVTRQVEIAHEQALSGKYWSAMTLNGLIYSHVLRLRADVIVESLEAGALAAGISGKGPAYAFVVEEQFKDPVLDVLKGHEGEVIVSKTRNRPSLSESTEQR